jgi:hypothetical protein
MGQQVADEFEVHLNNVENWRQLSDLARNAGGTSRTL